jgi:hypothetical protein
MTPAPGSFLENCYLCGRDGAPSRQCTISANGAKISRSGPVEAALPKATLRAIARELGLSHEAVRKAKLDGRISPDADLATAVREYRAATHRDGRGGNYRRAGAGPGPHQVPGGLPQLAAERVRRERVRAELEELELAKELGRVCDTSAVRHAGSDLAELLRQGLDQLVPSVILAVEAGKSPALKERALRTVLERFRTDFAGMVERRCLELTSNADWPSSRR